MSYRHHTLDMIVSLRSADEYTLQHAIEIMVKEHEMGAPSIEDRAARAEALAFIALELLRRMQTDGETG